MNAAAPFLEEDTRAVGSQGRSVVWNANDEIGLFYCTDTQSDPQVKNTKYSIMSEYTGLSAAVFRTEDKLEFTKSAQTHRLVAVYPYSADMDDPARFTVDIPATQQARDITDLELTMFSTMRYAEAPETILMNFDLCGPFVLFHMDASGTDISAESIDKIIIRSTSDESIAGIMTYNFLSESAGSNTLSETSASIEIALGQQYTLTQPVDFAFLTLPNDAIELTIEFESENCRAVVDYRMEEKISARTVNYIDINLAGMIANGSATIKYTGPIAPSNCYIAAPGEAVTIPVVRAFDVWKEYLDTDLSGTPETQLLWEDEKGLITGVSLDSENFDSNSIITVTTSSSLAGNAVVALTIDGAVKWSWHIWVVNYDPEIKTHSLNGREFMSRNLGAVNEEPNGYPLNYGLFYEWGRKDPFTGADRQEMSDALARPMYDKNGAEITPEPITGYDLAYLIENPTSFGSNILYTGSADADSWGNESGKTLFDPCPEGWRVPTPKGGVHPWADFEEHAEYLQMDQSANYLRGYLTNDGIWYPLPGDRTPDIATNTFSIFLWQGANGNYWTATANRTTQYSMYGSYFKLTMYAVDYSQVTNLHYGNSVRCERE